MTATEIARSLNSETLSDVFFTNMRPVRDGEGNLRELTAAEVDFINAVRSEMTTRGLV